MARVTVEDCVDKVPNRFELVLLAAHRSRMIREGSPITVDRDNDKDPVVSLREIADESVDLKVVKEALISNLQDIRCRRRERARSRPYGSGVRTCCDRRRRHARLSG